MKNKLINGRWNMIVPDSIADWDGGTGNHADRQGWEFCRFESFDRHLRPGMTLFDVGAEHGWISAVLAKHYVGAENMVLFEPSPEFWVNIRKTWVANGLAAPLACWPGFVDNETSPTAFATNLRDGWPSWCIDDRLPEVEAMAYRSLANGPSEIRAITIDDFCDISGIIPEVINIDVEGAELKVLQGAERTLREDRPLVWVSVHPDLMQRDFGIDNVEVLFDFMASCGYGREYLGTDHEQHNFFAPLEYTGPR